MPSVKIGPDKDSLCSKKCINSLTHRFNQSCVLGAQKNHLIETVLLSTHNIFFTGPQSAVSNVSGYRCGLTADPGFTSLILAMSHAFVDIDHEIISMVILLPSAESFKKDCCQSQTTICVYKVLVNRLFKLAQENVWSGELTLLPLP